MRAAPEEEEEGGGGGWTASQGREAWVLGTPWQSESGQISAQHVRVIQLGDVHAGVHGGHAQVREGCVHVLCEEGEDTTHVRRQGDV